MAGPTTAERQQRTSGPPRPQRTPRVPRVRSRTLVLALALAVLLAAGGVWVFYGSQWLRLERVQTSGTRVLTAREVLDAADAPLGTPLISVDTDAIEERLRSKLPRIDSVEAERSWPHEIGLKVTERKPVLLIEKGGKFVEVDAEGVRFATVERAPAGVPRLELTPDRENGAASLRRFGTDRLLREAVRVAGDLPEAVADDTRKVKVRSYDSITVELSGGRTVVWGSGEKGRTKATTLTALMKATPKARHFDVSVPTAPASSGS
ncbi:MULTISPECIES: cell division protein FtsQ/DivIB [Streptomyces]|uniref:cell division protein FtsQ/DivIB n=1 Tax=Streptomyces TaxID=1883 RepID=UPI001E2B5592|nr:MULTISPECIES: FtsQ-type POTRA domain-containing protein [Streptomyces]UFQ15112.1 FtsQ-type POTRA domain-containing protein [Streptomyces huasconensis]WCL84719.1 FtsQ-type POTRA domain-containing protein [Streptomyces sp. JCM 35825]